MRTPASTTRSSKRRRGPRHAGAGTGHGRGRRRRRHAVVEPGRGSRPAPASGRPRATRLSAGSSNQRPHSRRQGRRWRRVWPVAAAGRRRRRRSRRAPPPPPTPASSHAARAGEVAAGQCLQPLLAPRRPQHARIAEGGDGQRQQRELRCGPLPEGVGGGGAAASTWVAVDELEEPRGVEGAEPAGDHDQSAEPWRHVGSGGHHLLLGPGHAPSGGTAASARAPMAVSAGDQPASARPGACWPGSCVPAASMATPAETNSRALNRPWATRWAMATVG